MDVFLAGIDGFRGITLPPESSSRHWPSFANIWCPIALSSVIISPHFISHLFIHWLLQAHVCFFTEAIFFHFEEECDASLHFWYAHFVLIWTKLFIIPRFLTYTGLFFLFPFSHTLFRVRQKMVPFKQKRYSLSFLKERNILYGSAHFSPWL